jgi:5,10-methylenetetrahydrofolate dehydrogenase (NADP+) (EC 1.5.1.5)
MLLIDGKAISEQIKSELKTKVEAYKRRTGKVAGLSVIIIGENPASQIYVRNKAKSCVEIGMNSEVIELPARISHPTFSKKSMNSITILMCMAF